jgi:hypothetical protein
VHVAMSSTCCTERREINNTSGRLSRSVDRDFLHVYVKTFDTAKLTVKQTLMHPFAVPDTLLTRSCGADSLNTSGSPLPLGALIGELQP